ncbi:hypothetical protein SBOR_2877 [Sclerotinia borealis F-4128]|uniref:Uncharacterized protein n=1 Tax=Sclerotinia borealis (strain F-4128) TaxID=1432307 RepID=W9CL45_SCLBF|nr:hypothetical protein SBOR_2877 [Sclerotinia borealis F-4128]
MKRKLPKLCSSRSIDASFQAGQDIRLPGFLMSPEEVEAAICIPACTCVDCEHGFYTAEEQMHPGYWYRGILSSDETKQIAASHVNSIQQGRKYLVERLASHGDIIISRWKKKSQDKRQSLLLEAVPNLCEKRWIIPRHTFTPEGKEIPPINDKGEMEARSPVTRQHLLLQWLSLEVLKTNPAVLFALLHNRTAYPPQDWAAFDARQLNLSFTAGYFDVDFSAKCIVMYGLRYGEVVDWKADPAHRADILGFPKARLVLEAQAYLMSSLRKIVHIILQGIDTNTSRAAEKWKSMISMGFRHSNVVELWSPYTNQAFSSPPLFSINNLISLARIRLEAAADHLWLLQTESAYMKRFIANICHGGIYELIKNTSVSWWIVTEIIAAIASCWRWSWIKNECEHVKKIHDRFRDNIAQGENLPSKYDKAMGALELLVVNEVNRRATLLGKATPSRPGFSHNYVTTRKTQDHGPSALVMSRKGGLASDEIYLFENDPLDYCLVQLKATPDLENFIPFDHETLFSIMEYHLANSNFKEKSRVDEVLSNMVSDLAACHEMLVSIRLHRPQFQARAVDEVTQSENRKVWKVLKMKSFYTDKTVFALGAALFRDFYEVPVPTNRKDMAWVHHSKSLRKALESFWEGIRKDSAMHWKTSGFDEAEIIDELEYISATRTQEYLNATRAEEQQLLAKIESRQKGEKSKALTTVPTQTIWGSEDPTSELVTPPKSKEKTRPTVQDSSTNLPKIENQIANTNTDITPTQTKPHKNKISVTKRAYEMLCHMYPDSAAEGASRKSKSKSKSMEWDTFVHAMSDMGFSARNKGGSAVGFERDYVCEGEVMGGCGNGSGNGSGKIIFHRPHPVARIDPLMLGFMGRRLTRRFGWGREIFGVGDREGDGVGQGEG